MRTKLGKRKIQNCAAMIIFTKRYLIRWFLSLVLLLSPKVLMADSISSGESLARFTLWTPLCCMTMISPSHSIPIHVCSTIDDFHRNYSDKHEHIVDFADRIDSNEIFIVTDEQYENEKKNDIVPDLTMDSIFALNDLETVINKYFVYRHGNWYLKRFYNLQGQVVIFDYGIAHSSDDVILYDFNENYLFYCLQKWHYYCCIELKHLNVIIAPRPPIKVKKEDVCIK